MTGRARGRPPRASGPAFDHDAVEQLIRHGELVPQTGGPPLRVFPGVCELARRYGVSPSAISRFAKRRGLKVTVAAVTPRPARPRPAPRRRGRPPKDTTPIPWDRIDRLLVEGETTRLPNGTVLIVYPSMQEIADRHGVHNSTISRYATAHRCRERRADHRSALCAEVPIRLDDTQAAAAATGEASVTGDPDDDLIVARRIVVRNYRLAAEAGEVRANDPIVVRESDRLGREAHERKYGGGTENSFLAMLAIARERALAGRRRFEALPPEATGRIIEVTAHEVAVPSPTATKPAGDT